MDAGNLVRAAGGGDRRALARLLSLVDTASPALPELMSALPAAPPHSSVVGVTGSPGVGKSTLVSALVAECRRRDHTVAVLAVDPSSPFTGGSLLGDRMRMQDHATDRGVFIRSMSSAGQLGGLAAATPPALRVLQAVGFDVVLLETVGVGQSEVDVAFVSDTTVVVLAPGMGDVVQAMKAGVLEVGDVFVVNKADRDGVRETVRDVRQMIRAGRPSDERPPPVLRTVATEAEGVVEVFDALERHRSEPAGTGRSADRRKARAAMEIEAVAVSMLRRQPTAEPDATLLDLLAGRVAAGHDDAFTAAARLMRAAIS
ncbi:methylmalonyl Co-A mutase-associated GTPase MeaB [Actinophytocola sp.]|uniref:methylmalonyl Co-A mutase-associated GTPase MeaB n=1 Tax=Actinophytocola sp. TaxID=1872138 RepID=UPI0025B86FC2|nr:methylmalonyl Co-A mutase-associated GTPase MeaB [Actinophytocola sp.]